MKTRTFLPVALALCLVGLLRAPAAYGVEFRATHAVGADKFQSWFDGAVKAGLRAVFVTAYSEAGSLRFAGVAIEDEGGVRWEQRNGLTASQYQAKMDDLSGQGFRPLVVNGYADGGTTKFAAIWVKDGNDVAWLARHDLTAEAYQAAVDKLSGQGYRPVQLSVYPSGKSYRFAVIFNKDGAGWAARHDLSAEQYQSAFDKWTPQGYRPASICGYRTSAGVRYGVLFVKDDVAWLARHNLTAAEYQKEFDKASGQGYRPHCISAYPGQGGIRYAVVWVKDP